MNGRVEEEHQDILQNLEFAIVEVYRRFPELTDYEVRKALDALERYYKSLARQRVPRELVLDGPAEEVKQAVQVMCEWRLGHVHLEDSGAAGDSFLEVETVSADVINRCLKRLIKSVDMWSRKGGRQGYLEFISPFLMGDMPGGLIE